MRFTTTPSRERPCRWVRRLKRDYRWNEYEFYAQDSWKALKNLTITYGVRYSCCSLRWRRAERKWARAGYLAVPARRCSYGLLHGSAAAGRAGGGAANAVGEIGFDLNGRSNGSPTSGIWRRKISGRESHLRILAECQARIAEQGSGRRKEQHSRGVFAGVRPLWSRNGKHV